MVTLSSQQKLAQFFVYQAKITTDEAYIQCSINHIYIFSVFVSVCVFLGNQPF